MVITSCTVWKPAGLCTPASVAASPAKNTAHKTLTGIAVAQCPMNKCFYFQWARLMHDSNFFQRKFSCRNYTGGTLFLQKFHPLRACHSHLRAGVDIQIRKIPADKRKHTQILYDHSIKPRLIIRCQILKKLSFHLSVL